MRSRRGEHAANLYIHGLRVRVYFDSDTLLNLLLVDYRAFLVLTSSRRPDLVLHVTRNNGCVRTSSQSVEIRAGSWIATAPQRIWLRQSVDRPSKQYFELVRPFVTRAITVALWKLRRAARLHASAVAIGGCGILFLGVGGSGKSSLAVAASLAGATYLANEYAFLCWIRGHPRVLGLPQPATLDRSACSYFRHRYHDAFSSRIRRPRWRNKSRVDLYPVSAATAETSAPLSAIVFLEPNPTSALPRLRAVDASTASVLLFHSVDFPGQAHSDLSISLKVYARQLSKLVHDAASTVPSYHFLWAGDHEHNLKVLYSEIRNPPTVPLTRRRTAE